MQDGGLTQARSTTKTYDLAVYIGRFQPFHFGHLGVVHEALARAERVLILIGSANVARDTRNPFTFDERGDLVIDVLREAFPNSMDRISIQPLDDTPYDKMAWINSVNHAARGATKALRPRICLTGNVRDATSEYLTWFTAWDYLPAKDTHHNATAIRKDFFAGSVNFHSKTWKDNGIIWPEVCPPATIAFLQKFRDRKVYSYLMDQKKAEIAYKETWGEGPFQTVDPVIIKGDHVLMIERGGEEGTGMIGLPGGFLNKFERLFDGAVREGIEETDLFRDLGAHDPVADEKNARATLASYAKGQGERFDDPHRSRRGHLITEAFLFVLPDGHGLPPVQGKDDAKRAFWMPVSEVRPDQTFEDHAHIINRMLDLYA